MEISEQWGRHVSEESGEAEAVRTLSPWSPGLGSTESGVRSSGEGPDGRRSGRHIDGLGEDRRKEEIAGWNQRIAMGEKGYVLVVTTLGCRVGYVSLPLVFVSSWRSCSLWVVVCSVSRKLSNGQAERSDGIFRSYCQWHGEILSGGRVGFGRATRHRYCQVAFVQSRAPSCMV